MLLASRSALSVVVAEEFSRGSATKARKVEVGERSRSSGSMVSRAWRLVGDREAERAWMRPLDGDGRRGGLTKGLASDMVPWLQHVLPVGGMELVEERSTSDSPTGAAAVVVEGPSVW